VQHSTLINENGWAVLKGGKKLKYEDIRDLILSEEVRKRDSGETSCSSAVLNLETRGREYGRIFGRDRSRSRKGRSESRSSNQLECWNCGKAGHLKKNWKEPMKKTWNDSTNMVT
jgi:hypothetical protein